MLHPETNLHHSSIPIQRISLRATILMSLTPEIARKHGLIPGYRLIREKKARSNLSYHFIRVETSQFDTKESRVLVRTGEAVKEELRTIVDLSRRHNASVETSDEGKLRRLEIMIYGPSQNMVHSVEKILNKALQSESSGATATGPVPAANRNGRTFHVLEIKCEDIIVCVEMPMHYSSAMQVEERTVVQNNWNVTAKTFTRPCLRKEPGERRERVSISPDYDRYV